MKKIYSILLMAVALLISTNLKAVTVNDEAGLRNAIEKNGTGATGSTINIELGADINLEAPIRIYAKNNTQAGDSIILDLNGKTITAKGKGAFVLYKGALNLTGSGTIQSVAHDVYQKDRDLITVYGYTEPETPYYWSHLIVGENVKLIENGYFSTSKNSERCSAIVIAGFKTNTLGINYNSQEGSVQHAFGIVIDVYGYVYGNRYGFKTNGNVTENTGNVPVINFYQSSDIRCKENETTTSAAVYSSGYSKVNIQGTVSGSSPVYIKSGEVVIEDAVITCTNDEFQSIAGGSSGIEGSGAAITVESNSHYAGGQQLTIKGDTKVTAGADGVAVQETIDESDESKVSHITIQGGQLEGGAIGAVLLENNTVQNGKITVYGTTAEGAITINNSTATTEEVIPLLKPQGIDTYVVEVTDETTGNTTYVITEGTAPDAAEVTFNINNATAGADIDLSASGLVNKEQELTVDKKLGTLIINNADDNVTLTIAANKTLEVEKLILNEKAQIVVKAGAKLIVNGNQGITAPSVNNIVVEASEAAQGQVLFDPAVVSGRHPKATVQFKSCSYTNSASDYATQYFGAPIYNGEIEAVTISASDAGSYSGAFQIWDRTGWANLTLSNATDLSIFKNNFGFYQMQSNNPSGVEVTATFKGAVNGNNDVDVTFLKGWPTLSNAYLGVIDAEAAISAVSALGLDGYIYYYTTNDNGITMTWAAGDKDAGTLVDINPMRPMMFHNQTNNVISGLLDYSDLVWDPATAAPAPARKQAKDFNRAAIRMTGNNVSDRVVVLEGEKYEGAESAVKYNNEKVCLYITTSENKLDILKTTEANGTFIGYAVTKAGEYTMSFENLQGEEFVLVDMQTGTQTAMVEGATYTFNANENEVNDYRFQVLEARKMPTDVEVVDADAAAKAQKGIYSLVGAYLGEDLNVLPAGIYVVNGVKVVK